MDTQKRKAIIDFINHRYVGKKREAVLRNFIEIIETEKRFTKLTFDELILYFEQMLQFAKDVGGDETAERYIDKVCTAWVDVMKSNGPEVKQKLREMLEGLRSLLTTEGA